MTRAMGKLRLTEEQRLLMEALNRSGMREMMSLVPKMNPLQVRETWQFLEREKSLRGLERSMMN